MALSKRPKRESLIESGIALLTAVIVLLITQEIFFTLSPLKELELNLLDDRFLARGERPLGDSSHVVIVEINQESFNQIPSPYNNWPWPRSVFAKLVENLNEAGVRAIGIDVVMSYEDQFSPLNDSLFMNAIRKYGNVVVGGTIRREKIEESGKGKYTNPKENFGNLFFDADSSVGLVNTFTDNDGVVRRYYPFAYYEVTEKRVPSFGFAVLNKYYGLPTDYTVEIEEENFFLGNIKIPRYDAQNMLVNFYGIDKDNTFPNYKFINVIDDNEFKTVDDIDYGVDLDSWDDPNYQKNFKDKIVLVGSTLPEDRDIIPVSISRGQRSGDNLMYGVFYHANAIENVIRQDFLKKQTETSKIIEVIFLTLLMFFISSMIKRLKLRGYLLELINIIIAAGLIYLIYESSFYFFISDSFVISIVAPAIAIVLGYFSSTAYHFISARQQSTMIKGMFSQYVSGEFVDELITDPDKMRLGGENKDLSIFFSDIAGFSSVSEKMSAEELVRIMNEYLGELTDIIIHQGGTLDKYIGDAIMAFWGAPICIEDHAYKACYSALLTQERLTELNAEWEKQGIPKLSARIGINSGEVVVGNIGSTKRFNYTVMGDNVNLASRLEGANKQYGTLMMISDSTYFQVNDKIYCRELDIIRVKGRTTPTTVYELIGLITDPKSAEFIGALECYFKGLELYKKRNFNEATSYFEKCHSSELKDSPSKVYADRCKFYVENPPGDDWDGVFTMVTK
ncbi:MAG: CHASE2 domain-containing protein [Melioribacteraceae bacterium]|nr:CHASE2 domain-containing protein [Melioribacteraceae bacterium]MCF8354613.1 CHASE2 domain-containing protein [Melioribacteraceae bacterium]MCF8396429.1 CHASE2 domain-containing protein [Melioribacteraceae bacterium]MCF8420190.1 CHASE2 domain-containing protein [Melioribacteraceae bacterium]